MIKLLNTIAQEPDSFLSDCEMENESGALLLEKKGGIQWDPLGNHQEVINQNEI